MKRQTARSQRRKAPRQPRPSKTRTPRVKPGAKAPRIPARSVAPAKKKAPAKKAAARLAAAEIVVTPALKARALRVIDGLKEAYPDARCELNFSNALELLIATILAAQCTDARVNMVTASLFRKYRTPQDYLKAPDEVLKEEIKSTGFFNNKTKSIKAACRVLVERFGGEMPSTMDGLLQLPGVGRKSANVILVNVHGVPGVVVDTHMLRLSNRMGFSIHDEAEKVERDMMAAFPQSEWIALSIRIPWHGRRCCTARKPNCEECPVAEDCPKLID